MTAEEFRKKFIIKFKMDTKAVITYINGLLHRIETLEKEKENG